MAHSLDYVTFNRRAYDRLADEYRRRAEADRVRDESLISPFVSYIAARFGKNARILDIGPGNGVNLAMFAEHGFTVYGIDISPKMLEVARRLCPTAHLRLGDFLTARYPHAYFAGIFSKASLHLFPKKDAIRAICKTKELLVPEGMFYVTTTASSISCEGYIAKDDYQDAPKRYRKLWTPPELRAAVQSAGFSIYRESFNDEHERQKRWFNIWAVRQLDES